MHSLLTAVVAVLIIVLVAGGLETVTKIRRSISAQFEGRPLRSALRLAVILCHARQDPQHEDIRLAIDPGPAHGFALGVSGGWMAAWPQSAHLLREEVLAWQRTPWGLRLSVR